MATRNWLIAIALASFLAIPIAVHVIKRPAGKAVETERVANRGLQPVVVASGALAYRNQVTLTSEIVGRVHSVLVKEGEIVEPGQILLQIDSDSYQAEVAQLSASKRQSELAIEKSTLNLKLQRTRYNRYLQLRTQGMVEAVKMDEMENQHQTAQLEVSASKEALKQTEAQLQQARERLAKTQIRAPIKGRIISISIKPGETAIPTAGGVLGSVLMIVADTSEFLAELNVDESDINKVEAGQPVTIHSAADTDKPFHGHIQQVSLTPKAQNQQNKVYVAKAILKRSELKFQPGMSCRGEIAVAGSKQTLAVPLRAVVHEEEDARQSQAAFHVYRNNGSRAEKIRVEVGISDDSHIQILRGLAEGDEIIAGPSKVLKLLRHGDAIQIHKK